jgi:hypothetical protein
MTTQPISDHELDTLLAARDPLHNVALDGPRLDAALTVLGAEIRPAAVQTRVWSRRRGRRLVLAMSAGLVVCAVVLASALLSGGGSSDGVGLPLAVSPAQAAELNGIAERAAKIQVAGPGPGQWLYERFVTSSGGGEQSGDIVVNTHITFVTQQWMGPAGQQRNRTVVKSFGFDTPRDRAVYDANRSRLGSIEAATGQVSDQASPPVGRTPLAPQNMPDTTSGIVAGFHKLDKRPGDGPRFGADLFGEIVRILTSSTSQTQRAAALAAIKYVHGVQLLGASDDALGRRGTAIQESDNSQVTKIIVNDETGNLLQMSLRYTKRSSAKGTNFAPTKDSALQVTYLTRRLVDSMTALPGGGREPYHGPPVRPYRNPTHDDHS